MVNFAKSDKCAKLEAGPTVPMPGPIPAIAVAAELAAVFPSSPVNERIMLPVANIIKYMAGYNIIELFVDSLITLPFSFMGTTALG